MTYDLLIIGGGINGCGIARDAAGRGLSVALCEQGDLGAATSSASTKLIHGGLRYLEHYEFRLVRHALGERERLWAMAPHIIWPLRFVLPHRKGLRPAWMLRAGLFLYDHIGGRKKLPGTVRVDLARSAVGQPLRDTTVKAFEYSDCWVQDNRLVVLNARDAENRGGHILTHTRCISARRDGGVWQVVLQDTNGAHKTVKARALVNAAGPWVDKILSDVTQLKAPGSLRLVQGSHIVIRKLYDHDRCYIFQNPDGRIFFAIPYEQDFTLIGTTDQDYAGDPAKVAITPAEVAYLCEAASSYFKSAITQADVVWAYSGVRALFDDGAADAQKTTRDYVLTLDFDAGKAPMLSVFGGKITTYRCLAEDALKALSAVFPTWAKGAGWTARSTLPGGDFAVDGAPALARELERDFAFLTAAEAARLVRHYGTLSRTILGAAKTQADLGQQFGRDLTEAEVRYLVGYEYAQTTADIVWRRTKAGLKMTAAEIAALDIWMRDNCLQGQLTPRLKAG